MTQIRRIFTDKKSANICVAQHPRHLRSINHALFVDNFINIDRIAAWNNAFFTL